MWSPVHTYDGTHITDGTQNFGIILFSNTLDISLALLVLHGNAPGHPEKVLGPIGI